MAPHSAVVVSLRKCLEAVKRARVADAGRVGGGDPSLASHLSDLEFNLNNVMTVNSSLMARPVGCLCYKEHLRRGTSSARCHVCQTYGYSIDAVIELQPALRAIDELSHTHLGWDGEKVVGLRSSTFRLANTVAEAIGQNAVISLNSDGSIQFDKKSEPGVIGQITVQTIVDKPGI